MAGEERKEGRSPPFGLPVVYHRRLPHIQPAGRMLFVTWSLAGVMPVSKAAIGWNSSGAIFAKRDGELDRADFGPRWLAEPQIAEITKEVLLDGRHRGDYELGAWVIMPNHVHMLIEPNRPLFAVMREIKSGSARLANRILKREGRFWQREYYDRVVRGGLEEARITRYIENNPVRAGLCAAPDCWEWGSAHV